MSVLFQSVLNAILKLKRTCPACKRDQIVSVKEKNRVIPCKFCGTPIPPK
jgi:transcription elongation factor Elf1